MALLYFQQILFLRGNSSVVFSPRDPYISALAFPSCFCGTGPSPVSPVSTLSVVLGGLSSPKALGVSVAELILPVASGVLCGSQCAGGFPGSATSPLS